MTDGTKMYLDTGIECPDTICIWLPHLEEPMKAKRVVTEYPEFAAIFDGSAKENTLLFYYCVNKEEYSLDFIDEDAEEEVAELLGVTITEVEIEDDDNGDQIATDGLTKEDIDAFKDHINDIRVRLDAISGGPVN
jgi:hypothetical protein